MNTHSNKYKIFPNFNYEKNGIETIFKTTIRVEKDGKWYLWDVVNTFLNTERDDCIKKFASECVNVLRRGVVDENIIDSNGIELFKLDTNQDSELERIKKIQIELRKQLI